MANLITDFELCKGSDLQNAANMLRQQADRIATLEKQVDALLQHCDDPECWTCGKIICPYGGEMHFHHDGCPTCAEMESENE